MAVVGLANEANRLAAIYRIPVDDRYEALLDELAQLRQIDRRRAILADDIKDCRLRGHCREIYRRRDFRSLWNADAR